MDQGLQKVAHELDNDRHDSDEDEQRQGFFAALLLNALQLIPAKPAALGDKAARVKNAASVITLVLEDVRPRTQRWGPPIT